MQWREMGCEVGLGIGMLLLATIVATASVRSAFAQTEMVTVNIPPQELSSALTALADQTQLQPLYASELASGRTTAGVTRNDDAAEATRQLLEGNRVAVLFIGLTGCATTQQTSENTLSLAEQKEHTALTDDSCPQAKQERSYVERCGAST